MSVPSAGRRRCGIRASRARPCSSQGQQLIAGCATGKGHLGGVERTFELGNRALGRFGRGLNGLAVGGIGLFIPQSVKMLYRKTSLVLQNAILCHVGMNALTLAVLIRFWTQYPEAEEPLRIWYRRIRSREYSSFAEVKADFGSADWVGGRIVFDIGGNKFRLVVRPDFTGKRFYIELVGTHKQYDAWTKEQR